MPYRAFDICDPDGPEIILGINQGFIHSPSFPDYYGNKRLCGLNIGIPYGKRLVLYLLSLSMEGLSMINQRPNDYLLIDNSQEYYGFTNVPRIVYNVSDREMVNIKFKSDWITTARLRSPKGFLIYFERI
jgi:hypothetical protein